MTGNLSASILARLLTLAKQRGDDYNLLLNRFGMERLLARVSTSPHADRFLLKGALLFALWYDTPHRPTRDADLLGFGPDDEASLIATFRDIAAMDLGDGIVFAPDSVKADAIREDNTYGGTRITLVARIGSARCALQIDVGFGDAVTPGPQTVAYPTLLGDFTAPDLPPLTVPTDWRSPGLKVNRSFVSAHCQQHRQRAGGAAGRIVPAGCVPDCCAA